MKECIRTDLYNEKRIYGLVTPNQSRGQTLARQELNSNVQVTFPVIGSEHRRTFIPVLSQMIPQKPLSTVS